MTVTVGRAGTLRASRWAQVSAYPASVSSMKASEAAADLASVTTAYTEEAFDLPYTGSHLCTRVILSARDTAGMMKEGYPGTSCGT